MSSFCTSRRIARCSHTKSMLRSRSLALHKNNLTIYDFLAGSSDEFFLHKLADSEMLTYKKYATLSLPCLAQKQSHQIQFLGRSQGKQTFIMASNG